MSESSDMGSVSESVAETAVNLIRRWPRGHEKGARGDAILRFDRPDEWVIWSPFRLQRRRRGQATPAARASRLAAE